MSEYYDYYARADTREEVETRLVGAGLGFFDAQGRFVEAEGVVIDHMGPCIEYQVPDPIPEPNDFSRIETVKDPRWHTNIRTRLPLYEAQRVYLPLIPPPETPMQRIL